MLSIAFALMLMAEAVAGTITIIFSTVSYVDFINHLPPEYGTMLRIVLFVTMGVTSIHLFNILNNSISGDDDDSSNFGETR